MEYDEMLEKAYEELPEKITEKSRFKLPTFESFIQGKETIIKNFINVAGTLRRDPEQLIKYLAKELATVGTLDGNRLVLKGRFREKQLNDRLQDYVNTYVICEECKKPDTELVTQENVLFLRCEACGARKPIPVIK